MIIIFPFIIGSIAGSFLNVCIYRLPRKKSIIAPRSHCPSCGKAIAWFDNIPILSFLVLFGKCRFCKKPISLKYPVVEVLSGAICLLLFLRFGLTVKFFVFCYLASSLIVASFIDLEFHEIPDVVTLPGIVIGLGFGVLFSSLLDSFLGVIVGGGSIYLLGFLGEFIFKREAMGGGDVKLLAMIGAFLGWKLVLLTFFLAPFFGSAVGIVLKIKEGRDIIPYGPYLSLAALIAIFYGEDILRGLFLV